MVASFDQTHDHGPRPWLVLLLCALYAFAGLTGHDPWKSDDAIQLGIAHGFFSGGNWLVPTLAGETVVEAEPLYPWLAAATASATRSLLPFHAGARLASALFAAGFLFALGAAARRLIGHDEGWGTPLLAIGTLGLLVPIHEAQPASAILAACAIAYWGTSLASKQPIRGGATLGLGIGAALLAGGLLAALPLAVLLLPIAAGGWVSMLIALGVAAILGSAWLIGLHMVSPALLQQWWIAQTAALSCHGGFSVQHLELLAWFGWPVLYIALWALWSSRRHLLTPAIKIPLVGLLAGLLWFLLHEARASTLLPAVVPMVLLAASGGPRLRRGAANAWDWFSMMTMSIIVGLVWLGAAGLYLNWPVRLARNIQRLTPGFAGELWLPGLLIACALSFLWLAMLFNLPRSPWRVVSRWAAGVTVVWASLAALWLPWIDYSKTFRPVVASLREALPANIDCLGRLDFGLGQRAALDYFGGLRTRAETGQCHWLINQMQSTETADPPGWTRTWEGRRPGDRSEIWRLYRR